MSISELPARIRNRRHLPIPQNNLEASSFLTLDKSLPTSAADNHQQAARTAESALRPPEAATPTKVSPRRPAVTPTKVPVPPPGVRTRQVYAAAPLSDLAMRRLTRNAAGPPEMWTG